MKKEMLVLALSVLVLVGAGCQAAAPQAEETAAPDAPAVIDVTVDAGNVTVSPVTDDVAEATGEVKTFTVSGDNFAFAPTAMSVKKGDTVKILFKNVEGFHDLKIDEFNVATPKLNAGQEATIEFVADKAGSFEYYCSVGKHREMGMVGTLTVTE